ncbi:hypothetical protein F4809DRAFT_102248 [Biscogniauxia mediterranea]|nr:hypothetical protein F4809DRAFT_102248 [Biscogniauxia mediterranea]
MPRNRSSGRSAPARPSVPSRSSAPAQQQTRPAATYAPAQHAPAPQAAPQASQGPGLFGQMASTAAGVAVGSSIGHAIGGLFSGGGSAADPVDAVSPQQQQQHNNQSGQWGNNCAGATQNFTKCMDDHQGNMQICNWYLEQLKACQSAASQY